MYAHGRLADRSKRWPEDLNHYFANFGLTNIKMDVRNVEKSQMLYASENLLRFFAEYLRGIKTEGNLSKRVLAEAEENIERAAHEVRLGVGWSMQCVLVVGQKPHKEKDSAGVSAAV